MDKIIEIIDFKNIIEYFNNAKEVFSEIEYSCRDDLFILISAILKDLSAFKQSKIIVANKLSRIQSSIKTINEILEISLSNLKTSPLVLKERILDIKVLLSQIREFECKNGKNT